ncbi:MAG: hypothetical protein U0M06_12115 [Clostridia bacterium]|nr:hypothetical protein [Clostridia bacterium]
MLFSVISIRFIVIFVASGHIVLIARAVGVVSHIKNGADNMATTPFKLLLNAFDNAVTNLVRRNINNNTIASC